MTRAGDLREQIELLKQVTTPDGAGGSTVEWVVQITTRAAIKVLKAGEEVMSGRLQGKQSLVVTTRYQTALDGVDGTWRLRNVRTSQEYNIRAVTPDVRRHWCDVLCETDSL
jgi:SPP1 family predicted phage head-tail adaptor